MRLNLEEKEGNKKYSRNIRKNQGTFEIRIEMEL